MVRSCECHGVGLVACDRTPWRPPAPCAAGCAVNSRIRVHYRRTDRAAGRLAAPARPWGGILRIPRRARPTPACLLDFHGVTPSGRLRRKAVGYSIRSTGPSPATLPPVRLALHVARSRNRPPGKPVWRVAPTLTSFFETVPGSGKHGATTSIETRCRENVGFGVGVPGCAISTPAVYGPDDANVAHSGKLSLMERTPSGLTNIDGKQFGEQMGDPLRGTGA